MTDVLDRLDAPIHVEPPRTAARSTTTSDDVRPRAALAGLAVGAAAIHLAMVPAHMGEWALEGWAFIGAAWAQLLVAVLAFARPKRWVWWFAIVTNVAFVAAWAVTRTSGIPFGPERDLVEKVTVVDSACVAFELALVVGALGMLLLPLAWRSTRSRFLAPVLPVAVLAVTSFAIASPTARNHTHAHDVIVPAWMTAKGFNTFMNGHVHSHIQAVLDPATQTELDRQLAITRDVAKQLPTLQDAVDAGYRRAGPYVPGLGLHMINFGGASYLNPDGVLSDDDLRHPLSLLYDGVGPNAELGGFMYYAATKTEPEGFPGRNDGWHFHEHLCAVQSSDGFLDFPFGPDFGATQAQCNSVKGFLMNSQYMVHVWTVPGWDDMAKYGGVFAEENPKFGCSDGTWFQLPFSQWKTNPLNVCRSGASGHPV
ncbi:MAG: hypothetical protein V7636_1616 [Actinomycetota bacterium]|jgi:hypothetical protein